MNARRAGLIAVPARKRPRPHLPKNAAACCALLLLAAAPAAAAPRYDSCAGGPGVAVADDELHAFLSRDDTAAASDALAQRFPLLARDGFAPTRLLLWRRAGSWIYVALHDRADADVPCFSATIDAASVALTPALLRRYFPTT